MLMTFLISYCAGTKANMLIHIHPIKEICMQLVRVRLKSILQIITMHTHTFLLLTALY